MTANQFTRNLLALIALATLGLLALYLTSCTKHPNPSPALEKVNGAPTAIADDAKGWGEDDRELTGVNNAPEFPVVYFEFDSDVIRQEYADKLSNTIMQIGPKWSCQVEGHASEEGTTEYNLALGERRAHAVASYIATFPGLQTHETSYGEERPAVTPELSRRVEVRCK